MKDRSNSILLNMAITQVMRKYNDLSCEEISNKWEEIKPEIFTLYKLMKELHTL